MWVRISATKKLRREVEKWEASAAVRVEGSIGSNYRTLGLVEPADSINSSIMGANRKNMTGFLIPAPEQLMLNKLLYKRFKNPLRTG